MSSEDFGAWTTVGVFFTGLFGWLGKMAWDKRPKPHGVSHKDLENLRALLEEDKVDRAAFRSRIEASMVTKDDLHSEMAALRDHVDDRIGDVHKRLDEHVLAYHRP